MSEERDLSEGYPEFHRPPPDTVRHVPADDLPPIPVGPQDYHFVEFDENGVTRTEGTAWVTKTFIPTREKDENQ